MISKLITLSSWFVVNPVRLRVVLFSLVLALTLLAVIVPGARILADEVPGGGH